MKKFNALIYGFETDFCFNILKELKNIGISKVTLFADAEVVSFYKRQGWILEPRGSKCAFWYAN